MTHSSTHTLRVPHALFLFGMTLTVVGCNTHETKYVYYDKAEKHVRARAEYVDGVLNGKMIEYYENGVVMNRTDMKNGKMDGVRELYLPNGSLEGRIYFSEGVPTQVERLDSVSKTIVVQYFDPSGAIYNTLYLNADSSVQELKMLMGYQKNRNVNVGEHFSFDVRLVNVTDTSLFKGVLRAGSDFEETNLADTLLEVRSERNLYEFQIEAKPGIHRIAAQLDVNAGEMTVPKYAPLNFFLYAEYECLSSGRCKVTSLPLPPAFKKRETLN